MRFEKRILQGAFFIEQNTQSAPINMGLLMKDSDHSTVVLYPKRKLRLWI